MDSTATSQSSRPLTVLVAGAGIGSLTAALGLRRQGHHVTVFEQSPLAREVGAGIAISSNANGILRRLGIKLEDAEHGGVEWLGVHDHKGSELISTVDLTAARAAAPHPYQFVLRRDLHSALKNAATAPPTDKKDGETPVKIYTGSRVSSADAGSGTLHLEDGSTHHGDIVLGGDGVHSRTRQGISANKGIEAFPHRCSAFRFLVPTETLRNDPLTAPFVSKQTFFQLFRMPGRVMILYPGAGGAISNVACCFPNAMAPVEPGRRGWHSENAKEEMLSVYSDFGDAALAVLGHADPKATGRWPLMDLPNLPRWVEGRLALLGDAAHPFLPFMAQGGAMAIEDGGSVAALFPPGSSAADVPARLEIYERLRYHRASLAQQASRDSGTEEALSGRSVNLMPRLREMAVYLEKHDAWQAAEDAIKGEVLTEEEEEDGNDSDEPTLVGDSTQQEPFKKENDKQLTKKPTTQDTIPVQNQKQDQDQEKSSQQTQTQKQKQEQESLHLSLTHRPRHTSRRWTFHKRRGSVGSSSSSSSSASSASSASDSSSASSFRSGKRNKRALKRKLVAQARGLKAQLKQRVGNKREAKQAAKKAGLVAVLRSERVVG